jgi:hypothetical protein
LTDGGLKVGVGVDKLWNGMSEMFFKKNQVTSLWNGMSKMFFKKPGQQDMEREVRNVFQKKTIGGGGGT